MPQLAEIMHQIEELDSTEYAQLIHSLSVKRPEPAIAFPSIVSSPDAFGGTARFIRTRIPVWTVERMRKLGNSDNDILRSFPTLRAADLMQARAYADTYREETEQAIRENEA